MKENHAYEVKAQVNNTFLKTVSAFANYGGGTIQFWIADDGQIVGVSDPKAVCLDIENRINDSIRPVPPFQLFIDDRSQIITLKVEDGLFKPYYYKAKAYKRNDTATIEVDRVELNRLILAGENRSFDALPARNQRLSFSVLENKMKGLLSISELNQDILKTIGLVDVNGQYNNAAALLADHNDFPGIDCARFGETIDIIRDRETFDRESILKQFDDALELYRKYYQYDVIDGSVRKTIQQIPEKAYREALANALVHRTWDTRAQIRVSMYDDRVEIVSPGGLPEGMTQDEYLRGQVSLLRNPVIGNVFFRLHLIESFGTGVRRMNQAYNGSETKPIYSFSTNTITVTLPVVQTVEHMTPDERQLYQVLSTVGKSSSAIAAQSGFSKRKTLQLLKALIYRGIVRKIGNGRGTKYIAQKDDGLTDH
ncbi:MAG: AAA family ATPase [Eubacteriaceae bacterium]|uniref:AAA family ATPase n=1 Tax=Candidatus Pseudoramibacter fermentans TaxID=2594427 RepID=A0A6L5GQ85_9FIRM|nr:AAA family ATPase [Candidatus Pseudoramibacter fermentans]RRF92423.1 MAG: AAA family ATPase [Eubacteriaceae bacterium]